MKAAAPSRHSPRPNNSPPLHCPPRLPSSCGLAGPGPGPSRRGSAENGPGFTGLGPGRGLAGGYNLCMSLLERSRSIHWVSSLTKRRVFRPPLSTLRHSDDSRPGKAFPAATWNAGTEPAALPGRQVRCFPARPVVFLSRDFQTLPGSSIRHDLSAAMPSGPMTALLERSAQAVDWPREQNCIRMFNTSVFGTI